MFMVSNLYLLRKNM